MKIKNIFDFPELSFDSTNEFFEDIHKDLNFRIEKIYSTGQFTPEGQWLVQEVNEFVFLVDGVARIRFKSDNTIINLTKGDYFIIPKNMAHRVERTDPENVTTWLTVHFK